MKQEVTSKKVFIKNFGLPMVAFTLSGVLSKAKDGVEGL